MVVVKQRGMATSNTPRLKLTVAAEAGAEDINLLRTTRTPKHLEVEAGTTGEGGVEVDPQADNPAGAQADPQAGAQVRPVQREDVNRLLQVKRCTDHGLRRRAASLSRHVPLQHPQRHAEADGDEAKVSITLSTARETNIEAEQALADAVAVAVSHEGERGRGQIRAMELGADDPGVATTTHPKTEEKTTKVLPNETKDEDEEHEADIRHLDSLVSKRHSSMVGALCRTTIR